MVFLFLAVVFMCAGVVFFVLATNKMIARLARRHEEFRVAILELVARQRILEHKLGYEVKGVEDFLRPSH